MRIAIINQPTNNRGDESAHKALVRRLNHDMPNANIEVVFIGRTEDNLSSLRVDNKHNTYINLRNWWRWYGLTEMQHKGRFLITLLHPTTLALLWHLWRADIVMCAPGGINMGGFQSWYHIYELRLAKLLHKPIVYWGRSIGPFPEATSANREFKKQSLRLLHYFNFISLRDNKSQHIAHELGINALPTVDSAFLYNFKNHITPAIRTNIGSDYVVFVPNRLTWHYNYQSTDQEVIDTFWLDVMQSITNAYPNSKIVMLPQTFGDGSQSDGYEYFLKLATRFGHEHIFVAPASSDSDEQQSIIAGAHCVIGARYHSIVFAINAGVPFISLSYEHKMRGLLEMVDGCDSMVEITNIFNSPDSRLTALNQISAQLSCSNCNIQNIREKVMNISEECYSQLLHYLNTQK